MKKGRRKDHYWKFVKYKGDVGFYAKCSCGFKYECSKNVAEVGFKAEIAPEKLYNYCPHCGARKTKYYDEPIYIDKYWFE